MNALLKKEIRTRMRGNTIFVIENVYLVLLTGIFLLSLLFRSREEGRFGWEIGKGLFQAINYIQILLLVVASPSIVASTFTLEREQKTFDMLLATPLSLAQIARAKLSASLSFFFVLILVSLPMVSVCFILGGVSPAEILWVYFLTVEGVLLAGAIGLCYSAYFRRTIASVPVSSLTIIIFLVGTFVIATTLSPAAALINPLYAFWLMTHNWTAKFFIFEIPFWMPSLILTVLFFLSVFTYTVEILNEEKRRTSVWPRVLLFLLYSSTLLFVLGSSVESGPTLEKVLKGLTLFIYPSFVFCIVQAIVASGGGLSVFERKKLLLPWKGRYLSLRGWFGPGFLTGPRYSLLVACACVAIFAFGVIQAPMLEDKIASIVLTGGIVIACTLNFGMVSRLFSLTRRFQGKSLPRILAALCFAVISFGPHLVSYLAHKGATQIPNTRWDIFMLASPFVALGSALEPTETLRSYPYCLQILGHIPLALVTICVYALLLAVACAINLLLERKIRPSLSPS